MNPHNASKQTLWIVIAACLIASLPRLAFPQAAGQSTTSATAVPPLGGDPWPRNTTLQGAKISIYQPQLQSWTGNLLDAYAAVTIKTPGSNATNYGVIWFTARTEVDKVNRVVTLANFSLTKQSFPTLTANGSAYKAAFRGDLPWTQSMPLDELETALTTTSIANQQQTIAVNNDPPRIIVSTTPAILVLIDGRPVLRASGGGLQKVINTRALVVFNPSTSLYYLALMDGWAQSSSLLEGPWSEAKVKPPSLDTIKTASLQNKQNQVLGNPEQSLTEAYADREAPAIYVSTTPAELLLTQGDPTLAPIPPSDLQYVSNTGGDIFEKSDTQRYYVLIAGRWFTSPSLHDGPWTHVSGGSLPSDFSKIPAYSPKASVLVSVPGTPQAKEALIANQIPQTATISRTAARLTVKYLGAPDFQSIPNSSLSYAVNSATPVIQVSPNSYYACQAGVWFVGQSATGPWRVATSVPPAIYSIPASSPIHYVTYVRVYDYTPTSVYVGYTPGYYGTVVSTDGVVVYGTGYTYSPYIAASSWVPAPYTYGVGAAFSWSTAAGWALGFGLGLAANSVCGPWWGPVGYWGWGAAAPAWGWGAYGGAAASNFYGHWGATAYAGTRAAWANPYTGNVGAASRGAVRNPVTGTAGVVGRGADYNAYTGNFAAGRRDAAYNPTTGVVRGGAHGVYGNAFTGEAGSVNRGFAYKPSTGNGIAYNGNNVYADHDGNVYRASPSGGWQQRDANAWKPASSDFHSALDNQSFARGLGSQRFGDFSAGGWGGRFGGGGFADRGFGGGFGGGRLGGGFGGGGFRGGRR
jgi:hypothetical protein